jgi:hypothetical protein
MTTARRDLAHIETDLSDVLRVKTDNMLDIGDLLNEAKPLVEHGQWLPWLRRHTALSARSAQQYMRAAAWADAIRTKWTDDWRKCESDSHLPHFNLDFLSPKAIYLLASGKYGDDVIVRVLKATAAERHISDIDVRAIAKGGDKAPILREIAADAAAAAAAEEARLLTLAKAEGFETVEAWEAASEAETDAQADAVLAAERAQWAAKHKAQQAELAEAEAILDGGPDPDLPPTPEPVPVSSESVHVATFEKAIGQLRSIMTKPLRTFASANVSLDDIEQVTLFLQDVASANRGPRHPGKNGRLHHEQEASDA